MASRTGRSRVGALLLCASWLVTACHTYRPVAVSALTTEVRAGDRVRVQNAEGRRWILVVRSIDAEAIEGSGVRVPLEEIATAEVRRTSPRKSWRTVGIVAAATAFTLTVIGLGLLVAAWE